MNDSDDNNNVIRESRLFCSIRSAVSHLTRLDDFNCVKLSHGFFSQVFKVTHHSTRKVMVLKMNKHSANRGNALKELELLNRMNHENIVAFMGCCVHEGQLHPLLEYISGGTLETVIRRAEPFEALKLAKDICAGMEYVHSLRYIHRDLTSRNVFIRNQSTAVIGDFGFATPEPSRDQHLPQVGSPYWSSPECIKHQWYNHKTDVFSFGIIACELNWRVTADPDDLPRDHNFLIRFDKLSSLIGQSPTLAQIAQLACQLNAQNRPEFTELILMLSFVESNGKMEKRESNSNGDIFDRHEYRRSHLYSL